MDPFDRAVNKEVVHGANVGFYIHLGVYLAVNVLLVAIWATSGRGYPWFIYPILGWGIGLVAHAIAWRASRARARRPAL